MKLHGFALAAAFLGAAGTLGATSTSHMGTPPAGVITADRVPWIAEKDALKGTYLATMAGDPHKSGWYVIRLKLPAGTVYKPHFHETAEYLTVLTGELWVGFGDVMNERGMTRLGPGAFMMVPANVHHFAEVRSGTIIQVEGTGPQTMTSVSRS